MPVAPAPGCTVFRRTPPRPEPFTSRAAPAVLADLRARLRATRWPDAPEDAGWSLGTDLAYLRELVAYWADGFDWPAQEAALARLPRFRVAARRAADPLRARPGRRAGRAGAAAGPVPRLAGLVLAVRKVIPLLTDPGAHGADPADAFDVVVPDMPGYGYSGRPAGPPLDSIAVAGLWAELMGVLGYPRFGAAGGDIGSGVSRYLALDYPARVVAVHRMDAGLPVFAGDPADWRRRNAPGSSGRGLGRGRGRLRRHAPHQAADRRGRAHRFPRRARRLDHREAPGLERLRRRRRAALHQDEILTNVTIYWLTATIGSSMRMYHANAAIPPAQHARRVAVPSGFSLFPADIGRPPRAWLERTANVVA